MALRGLLLLLVIIAASQALLKRDLTICPNQEVAKRLIANVTVDYPGRILTMQVKTKRIPTLGMLDRDINCIEAIDTSGSQNSGEVDLIEGGLNQRFAAIRFRSHIGGGLQYVIQVYSSA